MAPPLQLRRRSLTRLFFIAVFIYIARRIWSGFYPAQPQVLPSNSYEIKEHGVFERDRTLNVHKHPWLQSRMGRDERDDIFTDLIREGVQDYWDNYQMPYMQSAETAHLDAQNVYLAIDQLLSLNGWVAALCPTLVRPFGQNTYEAAYDDLVKADHLYFIAIVIHSADHFLVDQLAVIVQMSKRLGSSNLFVSMLDYDSTDSTETLTDLCEAVLTLLGVPFRIRRVPAITEDPAAAYYPLEEAYMRNLALEPLHELQERRKITFSRVVWLKGFTCPNDIFETLKVSYANEAAMVCGMDWAEHNGFFIFSDRWRTRDIEGDQFRRSKSSSQANASPPRDPLGAARYAQHLPFQVFCCESGTHVVDPAQSYYQGIEYRHGMDFHNVSNKDPLPIRPPDAPCLDSSQAWFCRDLWVKAAGDSLDESDENEREVARKRRRDIIEVARRDPEPQKLQGPKPGKAEVGNDEVAEAARKAEELAMDPDANAGSDYDAMPEEADHETPASDMVDLPPLAVPNSQYRPARILVNPRCVTTYAGISHTQLALYLFGDPDHEEEGDVKTKGKYVLEDWEGAPEGFVCQEQIQTGGRKAMKTQRRLGFSVHAELEKRDA